MSTGSVWIDFLIANVYVVELSKIFVNYRREQVSGWAADAIAARLQDEFGKERVFLDVNGVAPSAKFADVIRSEIARAAALVVVMGENWHRIQDEAGNKRIAEEDDWVREEIRTALERKIPIFILLLDDAKLPQEDWLPDDIRPFLGFQSASVRQATVATDLVPVLEQLAKSTEIRSLSTDSSSRLRSGLDGPRVKLPAQISNRAASRAPIVIAIEETSARIKEEDLLPAERHLTIDLGEEHVKALRSIHTRLSEAKSVDAIIDMGLEAGEVLSSASHHRLHGLLQQVAAAEQKEGFPQPVAWSGHLDLLTTLYRAILVMCIDDGDAPLFSTVTCGSHYFHPLSPGQLPRSMQGRVGNAQPKVRIKNVDSVAADDDSLRTVATALENEIVLLSADEVDEPIQEMVKLVPRQPTSLTRVIVGFGPSAVDASQIDAALAVIPCISIAGTSLRDKRVMRETERALALAVKTQAVPVILSRVRGDKVVEQLSGPPGEIDLQVLRDSLGWSTWSWVGRPLFSNDFGEVRKAAYPHLMDLRDVATRDWYYERFADIPDAYKTDALTAREPRRRFHLYLSGEGGAGKSCFLRSIYETLEINNPNVLPVWYKVHAPSLGWEDVETQIKMEVDAALKRRLGIMVSGLLSADVSQLKLGNFLLDLLEKLRPRKDGINEIVLFIDQLERTFESGENPEPHRLNAISEKIVSLLQHVGVDKGVRIFIASRKQYLADFLSSFERAEEIKLHFNVLQTLSVEKEGAAFVKRVIGWCNTANLTTSKLKIDESAAQLLATRERGHPLNMMLALIELLSRGNLPEEVDESTLEELRPWQRRFYVDEALMGKDELDWYFFLAMAHARTEIVRREEVLWRLGLVNRDLARRIKELGPKGVLERLWLLGHLGRTMHPRPQGEDSDRFLEFFHANLRDHLVTNVMNRAEERARDEPGGASALRRGTPPAWRALDRLREIARDWEQVQQPLAREDISVLMEHKESFTERVPVFRKGRSVEVENFYLLFMRDVEERRDGHFQAAKECVAYSALVHDVHGRWAMRTLFPKVAGGSDSRGDHPASERRERNTGLDDSQVGCCRRWLRSRRADRRSRWRILHYLVELRDRHANRLLAELVFDSTADDEPWQQLASILAEPLVAATHRSAFLTYAIQHLLDEGISFEESNWYTDRFGAFVVSACAGERNEVSHVLETLLEEVTVLGDRRLEPTLRNLTDSDRIDRWLGAPAALSVITASEIRDGSEVELRVGNGLAAHIDSGTLDRWMNTVAARLGVPLPRVTLSHGEVSNHRRTEDATRNPPLPGHELQLLVRGRLIGLGRFFPDRVQTLTRDWDGSEADGAIPCFNEALWEPVRWIDERALSEKIWRQRRWPFDQAACDWLQGLFLRYITHVFSYDSLYPFFSRVAQAAGRSHIAADLQSLSNVLYPIWLVITRLLRERVPFGERNLDLLLRLIDIVRESDSFDIALTTLRLREHVSDDLCRAFADSTNQLFILLLELDDERWLRNKLIKTRTGMSFDKLKPEEALRMVAAVRDRFEEVARDDHASPVLVCEDYLRVPLFDMLQRFDPRIFVLSSTELSPDVRLTSRGVIRRFSPAEGTA